MPTFSDISKAIAAIDAEIDKRVSIGKGWPFWTYPSDDDDDDKKDNGTASHGISIGKRDLSLPLSAAIGLAVMAALL